LLLLGTVVDVTVAVGLNEFASLGLRFFSVGDTADDDPGGASLVPLVPSVSVPLQADRAAIALIAMRPTPTPKRVPISFIANVRCAICVSSLR